MESPLFSIIIPTFNSARTLKVCLDSIASQNFADFEVIVVDGVSMDNTITLATSFQEKIARLQIISETDSGIYDAMNKGIKKAKGEWLYFLGSDDKLFSTEVLQKVAEAFKEDDHLDVIYGNIFSKRFNGIYDGEFTNNKILSQNICHQAIFFSSTIFKSVGNFDIKFRSHADWDHNFRWFFSKKIKKKFINLVIADYADGGFSTVYADLLFLKQKHLKFLLSAHHILPFKQKYSLLKDEITQSLEQKKYKNAFALIIRSPYLLLS